MQTFGKLVLTQPGGQEQEFALAKVSATLGRATINDIVLPDAKASRTHARLEWSDPGYTLIDLGSANGTWVNGVRVERATLTPGDLIGIGNAILRFELGEPRTAPEVTLIDSEADLDATLHQSTLAMTLGDTSTPRLVVHMPDKTWEVPLRQEALMIGRLPPSDIMLDDAKASRNHARIERRGAAFFVRDLQSRNGTWVGNQRIDERQLQDRDTIRIGNAQLVFKRGFTPEDLTLVEGPRRRAKRGRRPVVIVPGFMGSELWQGSDRLWVNVKNLFTRPELFRWSAEQSLEPRGLVNEVVIVPNLIKLQQYGRLGDYLEESLGYERGKDLLEFAYDWRQDNRLSAQRLAEAIDNWSVSQPITIIAHSMGSLVSRYYVERLGGKKKVERLIFMGGPHYGTPKAIALLVFGPDLLPFGLLGERMREVIATFPSVYQVLPTHACVLDQHGQCVDVVADEAWLPEARRPLLRLAREFLRELGEHCSVPCVSIFGYGLKTLLRARVQRDAQGWWEKVDLEVGSGGDNMVPEVSAVFRGSEIHPVRQQHDSLYVDNDVKMRLKLELTG